MDKPIRLTTLEEYWDTRNMLVEFDNDFGGEWMVTLRGHFADFEVKEISNALRAANKAKGL